MSNICVILGRYCSMNELNTTLIIAIYKSRDGNPEAVLQPNALGSEPCPHTCCFFPGMCIGPLVRTWSLCLPKKLRKSLLFDYCFLHDWLMFLHPDSFFWVNYIYLFECVLCGMHVLQHICRVQRTICKTWLPPFTK
jgi:hypothetical protein